MITKMIGMFLVLFVLASLMVGQDLREGDYTLDVVLNVSWDDAYEKVEEARLQEDQSYKRFYNIVYKFTDFVGYTGVEVVKWGAEFGYENPEYNYEFYWKFVWLIIIAILVGAILPLIIPVIALTYIFFLGIKNGIVYLKGRKKE